MTDAHLASLKASFGAIVDLPEFRVGYDAYRYERVRSGNPYADYTKRMAWSTGLCAAMQDEKARRATIIRILNAVLVIAFIVTVLTVMLAPDWLLHAIATGGR